MSSLLYLLSYNPYNIVDKKIYNSSYNLFFVRTKDLHLYLLGMNQLCYYYINPRYTYHIYLKIISPKGIWTHEYNDENITS